MTEFAWPHGETAAVSLRFDDGTEAHRTVVAPLLSSYGLVGTFYVMPSGSKDEWHQRAQLWQAVLDAGHEIGNHSMMHPAPTALTGRLDDTTYEGLTLEAYSADVLEAHRRLESAFGPREWTYCYPCYGTDVGMGRERQSLIPFIADHFAAACVGGEITRPYNVPEGCDLHALMGIHSEGLTGEQLIAHAENARELRRWAIYIFHGIGEGHIPVNRRCFKELLSYLSDHRADVWQATVSAVACHIQASRAQHL